MQHVVKAVDGEDLEAVDLVVEVEALAEAEAASVDLEAEVLVEVVPEENGKRRKKFPPFKKTNY